MSSEITKTPVIKKFNQYNVMPYKSNETDVERRFLFVLIIYVENTVRNTKSQPSALKKKEKEK